MDYVPETCRAKDTTIKLLSCIKLAFHFISKDDVLGFWTFTGVLNTTHIFGMKNYFCPQM